MCLNALSACLQELEKLNSRLDPSQHEALRLAFSRRVALIQAGHMSAQGCCFWDAAVPHLTSTNSLLYAVCAGATRHRQNIRRC
jgi:hypothetical protein